MDSAEGFMIVPVWPTQSWYPKLLHMLVDVPPSTVTTDYLTNARDETRRSPLNQENGSDCLQIVRQSYEKQGFSQKATSIILQSWRKGTTKRYSSHIKRWTTYCHQKQIDLVSATVPQALDFLVELYETGVGYSGINTARSALSSVLRGAD